ncbi:MAG: mobilization protein MbpA [Prevotella sp.]|jgi:hypothetical protein
MKKNKYFSITFCCSEDEQRAIKNAADSCGMSVSRYCKQVILSHRPKQRLTPEDINLLQSVRKIASDLQRIANYFKNGVHYQAVAELPGIIKKLKFILYDCNS